jgi:hypothetical protein
MGLQEGVGEDDQISHDCGEGVSLRPGPPRRGDKLKR